MRRWAARVGRAFAPALEPDLARDVRREQLALRSVQIKLFSIVGTGSIILLALDFRTSLLSGLRGLVCAAIPLTYVMLSFARRRWARAGNDLAFLRRSLASLAFLGVLWGMALNLFGLNATPAQRDLLYCIMIALVSTPMIASPVILAFAFWTPSVLSGLLLIAEAPVPNGYLLACFGFYVGFTFGAIVVTNRFMLERSVGRIVQERQNRTINVFLQSYLESASDWLWETNADLRLLNVSPRLAELSERPAHHIEGQLLVDVFASSGEPERQQELTNLLEERAPFRDLRILVPTRSGERWWSITGRATFDEGVFQGYRGIGADITEIRRAEDRVEQLALNDSLTGLANRQSFMDRLTGFLDPLETAKSADRDCPADKLAVLLLDLDRFKAVNDTLGHPAGDELLVAVAERLRHCVRAGAVVARLGGDEFGVLVVVADEASAAAVARRIVQTVGSDYKLAGMRQMLGVSVGVALFARGSGETPAICMQQVDLALYAAKEEGRGKYRLFAPEMIGERQARMSLQRDLESAIFDRALRLVYQPIVDLETNAIVSIEALARWDHPRLGAISPSTFIPLAEETGLIVDLGDWALREACEAATRWPDQLHVAVNVSPRQIRSLNFEAKLARLLTDTGLPAGRLDVELTEHAYLNASAVTLNALERLRELGCRLVLDDFGTGYSSLSYLTSFTFDALKLDRSFVHGLGRDRKKLAIVQMIAQLALNLGITVVAEGVERAEEHQLLTSFSIRFAQGFYFHRPLERAELDQLLNAPHDIDRCEPCDQGAATL